MLVLIMVLGLNLAHAQTCPDNIDFKLGNFNHWECSTGSVLAEGELSLLPTGPITDRQTLNSNKSTAVDYFGDFSVVAPNGSLNTLRLGNQSTGKQAEQVSYTYSIPANKQDFIFTYYYAVVLQLTKHSSDQRPRFSVKLTDLTSNEIIPCGTHDFISGDGLGAFKKSLHADSVEYRDWSTVAINLGGRGGHTIRFDFATNDCTLGGHFGYAYLSFSDPCDSGGQSITGNIVCSGAGSVTLTAPPGFDQYSWHLPGSDVVLSGYRQYVVPTPPDGTQYQVDALSLSGVGQGCPAAFTTTVHTINQTFVLNVKPAVATCQAAGADLTSPAVTAGTSVGTTFKYFIDAQQKFYVRDPTNITQTGTYYILGTSPYGCTDLKSVDVTLVPDPVVTITNPKRVCYPQTIDITDPAIVGGLNSGLIYEYFLDALITKPVPNPKAVSLVGSYYVKITNSYGCYQIFPIKVDILPIPYVKPNTITGCSPFNITLPVYHADDTNGLIYKYFTDAAATIALANPESITREGIYYVTAENEIGCTAPAPVAITIKLYPPVVFEVENPNPVTFPATIDLRTTFSAMPGYTYSYNIDSAGTLLLPDYATISQTGNYYITAISDNGCTLTKKVTVEVDAPDEAGITAKNTFTPNGDGINDEFAPVTRGAAVVKYLKIYNRYGNLVFETKDLSVHWKGNTNSSALLPPGTYYWVFNGYDTYRKKDVKQSGSITLIR